MNKWLAKFLDDTLEDRTDIPDTLPDLSRMSVLSVPFSGILPEVSFLAPKSQSPTPPLQPGWLAAYRYHDGSLRGGCDERESGTVRECRWDGQGWTVVLSNGSSIPLSRVVSVGKTDGSGRIVAAWTARSHGYDGDESSRDGGT